MPQPVLSDKRRVEKEVVEVLIKNLYSGDISVDKARLVAKETLAEVERIEKHEETVVDFYKSLSYKFPSFNILYTKIKGEIAAPRESSAHKLALTAINSGNIEEAHKIAQSAIAHTAHETHNDK